MASSLKPARRRAATGRAALVALVVAGGVGLSSIPAAAAPETPGTSQEAAALVAARAHDLEVVTEQFNDARVQLEAQQAAAQQAAAQVVVADAAVAVARDHVREVARSAYTGDQLSTLQAMLSSSSPDQLLDRVGTLDTIAQHGNEVLGVAEQATQAAAAAKATADKAAADAQAQVQKVTAQQADLQSQIAQYQADYNRLSAQEQERARQLAEQQAAQQAAAAAAQAAAQAARDDLADRSAPAASRSTRTAAAAGPAAPVAAASSGAARTAVSTALAQQGEPYVWGAAGPGSFDCSGLVQYAYRAAGVSLPHSSSGQASMGRAVSRSQLQPGDLIAFYSPVSHIGIYIGDGKMVHAPTSGDVVKVASIDAMGGITAMRRLVG
jgi:peptidoglycan DL-endopeptidase CwlO